jgi:hypothetical protein
MNTGRLVGAALAVAVVRVLLNFLFYGLWMKQQADALGAAHPGIFREVIPGFIAADVVFAFVFVFLFAKCGGALGGGVKAGVVLGILVAILSPLLANAYIYFSFTIFSAGWLTTDSVYQLVSHVISGALAGAVYKS